MKGTRVALLPSEKTNAGVLRRSVRMTSKGKGKGKSNSKGKGKGKGKGKSKSKGEGNCKGNCKIQGSFDSELRRLRSG